MKDYINALFHVLDLDCDGYISKDDYINAYSEIEDPLFREKYWTRICPNDTENIKINKELFDELCLEFLVSTNPEERGNWIFGIF